MTKNDLIKNRTDKNGNLQPARLKVIACEVLRRYLYKYLHETPYPADVTFIEMRKHVEPDDLRKTIQEEIDKVDESRYDVILLAFGLCGNSTVGVHANDVPIVIPRAHDCCTFFMGSKDAYNAEFADKASAEWCADGYYEGCFSIYAGDISNSENNSASGLGYGMTYEQYAEEYGEENAQFLFEMLGGANNKSDDELIYISTPETQHLSYRAEVLKKAAEDGKKVREIAGNTDVIRKFCFGEWEADEFLIVKPGEKITGVYDRDEIIRAVIEKQ